MLNYVSFSCKAKADEVGSIPSSGGSVHAFPSSLEINSGMSPNLNRSKKRPYSSSKHTSVGLEPVAEGNNDIWLQTDPNFRVSILTENGSAPEHGTIIDC